MNRRDTLAILWVCGCAATHELVVDVRSDLSPGYEALAMGVGIVGREDTVRVLEVSDELLEPALRAARFEVPDGAHVVEVELRTNESTLLRRVLATVDGTDTGVTVSMLRSCVGVACPGAGDSADAQFCLGGACVAEGCVTGGEAACGGFDGCVADDDCQSDVSCAVARCRDGVCVLDTDDSMCGASEYCAALGGCTPIPEVPIDAGAEDDAGMSDAAATDVGPPDVGPADSGPTDPALGFEAVAAGASVTCAVRAGEIWCFGPNGPDGDGIFDERRVSRVANVDDASAVCCGSNHCCALRGTTVSCWGSNEELQCGVPGPMVGAPSRVDVEGLPSASAIACGSNHSCAVTVGREVYCWGNNDSGQLGSDMPVRSLAVPVSGLPAEAAAVSAGTSHTCALLADGTVACWGSNSVGQLGVSASTIRSSTPVRVVGAVNAVEVGATHDHSIARTATGGVLEWGSMESAMYEATPVAGLGAASSVSAGSAHGCAVVGGVAQCWGENFFGQLGVDPPNTRWTPAAVPGVPPLIQVRSGEHHSCAITDTSELWCWGRNEDRQIDFDARSRSKRPTRMVLP